MVKVHPCLNQTDVTIVTDQDNRLETAIAKEVSHAVNFHCSYHRSQNIINMCGAKSGNRVYSAHYVYNSLLQCRTVTQTKKEKEKNFPFMHSSDLKYLNNLSDHVQYPAARCALSAGTYMYHRTLSATVESMNAANREMRAKTAVDPLNACILLMRMECKRFVKQCRLALETDTELTCQGRVEYDEVFSILLTTSPLPSRLRRSLPIPMHCHKECSDKDKQSGGESNSIEGAFPWIVPRKMYVQS